MTCMPCLSYTAIAGRCSAQKGLAQGGQSRLIRRPLCTHTAIRRLRNTRLSRSGRLIAPVFWCLRAHTEAQGAGSAPQSSQNKQQKKVRPCAVSACNIWDVIVNQPLLLSQAENWRLLDVRLTVELDPGKDTHDSSLALCNAVAQKLKCKVLSDSLPCALYLRKCALTQCTTIHRLVRSKFVHMRKLYKQVTCSRLRCISWL